MICNTKIVSEYDQEVPQSQTADNPEAPRGRAAQPSRDTSCCFDSVNLLRITKMVKCLHELEYVYCVFEKIETLFLKLEDRKL